jgi:metal-responsive CopG/Arc/MetJ family transcriptional regulator
MRILSFKLPVDLDEALEDIARSRGTSRSAIVHEALESYVKGKRRSATPLAGQLVGSVDGPADLATNGKYMSRYGK